MAKEKKKVMTKEEKKEDQRRTLTGFLLMCPTFIIALLAFMATSPLRDVVTIIMLVILQMVLLKAFIDDFYRKTSVTAVNY